MDVYSLILLAFGIIGVAANLILLAMRQVSASRKDSSLRRHSSTPHPSRSQEEIVAYEKKLLESGWTKEGIGVFTRPAPQYEDR